MCLLLLANKKLVFGIISILRPKVEENKKQRLSSYLALFLAVPKDKGKDSVTGEQLIGRSFIEWKE